MGCSITGLNRVEAPVVIQNIASRSHTPVWNPMPTKLRFAVQPQPARCPYKLRRSVDWIRTDPLARRLLVAVALPQLAFSESGEGGRKPDEGDSSVPDSGPGPHVRQAPLRCGTTAVPKS